MKTVAVSEQVLNVPLICIACIHAFTESAD